MSDVSTMPKMQVITPDLVRASVRRARRSLEAAAEEIVWQIEMEAWVTLGYASWDAMREAEYGGAAFMVPSKSRPELVARIKAVEIGRTVRGGSKHLTDQEIADTVGVSRETVQDDLNGNASCRKKLEIQQNAAPDDDVIDAEAIEEKPMPAPKPDASRELTIVNDIRLYVGHIGSAPEIARLSPTAKQHIIDALIAAINELRK